MDQSIIRNLMLTKTDKDIAMMVELPVESVTRYIATVCEASGLFSYQMKMDLRKAARPVREKAPRIPKPKTPKHGKSNAQRPAPKAKVQSEAQRRKEEDKKLKRKLQMQRATIEAERSHQRRAAREPMFKTKQVNWAAKVSVRIDAKTTILIDPGQNPEEARQNYLFKHSKNIKED